MARRMEGQSSSGGGDGAGMGAGVEIPGSRFDEVRWSMTNLSPQRIAALLRNNVGRPLAGRGLNAVGLGALESDPIHRRAERTMQSPCHSRSDGSGSLIVWSPAVRSAHAAAAIRLSGALDPAGSSATLEAVSDAT